MRQWTIRITPERKLKANCPYEVQVGNVSKNDNSKAMLVELEFLNTQLQHKRVVVELPIAPLHADGITAQFFRAAGQEVTPGELVAPLKSIGAKIMVRFAEADEDNSIRPTSFAPMNKDRIKKRSKAKPVGQTEEQQDTPSEESLAPPVEKEQ